MAAMTPRAALDTCEDWRAARRFPMSSLPPATSLPKTMFHAARQRHSNWPSQLNPHQMQFDSPAILPLQTPQPFEHGLAASVRAIKPYGYLGRMFLCQRNAFSHVPLMMHYALGVSAAFRVSSSPPVVPPIASCAALRPHHNPLCPKSLNHCDGGDTNTLGLPPRP
jgi:hypothetical protein